MIASILLELVGGLGLLGLAGFFWFALVRASRWPVPPAILRSNFGGDIVTVSELALMVFGLAAVIDVMTKIVG